MHNYISHGLRHPLEKNEIKPSKSSPHIKLNYIHVAAELTANPCQELTEDTPTGLSPSLKVCGK